MSAKVILVLGSNLGDRVLSLLRAVKAVSACGEIERVGSLFITSPFGIIEQPEFLNVALSLTTELAPLELLDSFKKIEIEIGRVETYRWGPRAIDIDIALFGDLILDSARLKIPHPGLVTRDFFIAPILEIEPDATEPVSGKSLSIFLEKIPESEKTIKGYFQDKRWLSIIT